MSRKSKITAVMLLLILIAAFCAVYLVFKPSVTAGEKAFTVKVVHADRSEKTFSYRCSDEYLGDTLLREGLIKGEKGAYGIYILYYLADIPAGPVSLDEIREGVETLTLESKKTNTYEAQVAAWVAEANVEYFYENFGL